MKRVAAEKPIIFFDFELFRLQFFIASGRVARWRLAFFARFRAFNGDYFPRHKSLFLFGFLFRLFLFTLALGHRDRRRLPFAGPLERDYRRPRG